MSALAVRLRQLRMQSGQPSTVTPPKPTLSPEVLRLIQGRSRIQGAAQRFPSGDRMVPGVEIEPGLVLTEAVIDWGNPSALIDTAFARWEEPVAHDRLLHFDTETTGLAGGTGTRAWMIGAADWLPDGRFRLRQLTTTTMGAETTMLRTFATWVRPDSVLVSYNGKCYDSPLLKTRYPLGPVARSLVWAWASGSAPSRAPTLERRMGELPLGHR